MLKFFLTVLLSSILGLGIYAAVACTAADARVTTGALKTVVSGVDLPGFNEEILENYLTGLEGRFAALEATKKPGEKMNWREMIGAILGTVVASTSGAAMLDRRSSKKRSKGRAILTQLTLGAVTKQPGVNEHTLTPLLAQANLDPTDTATVQTALLAAHASKPT